MELLEMMDTVFECLKTYSHDDPNFPKLKEWLKPHNLSEGEIDDCLKKLNKDGYLYFMDNEKKNIPSDVMGMYYNRQLNYLISFDGKYFLATVGGYRNKHANDLQKIANENATNKRMEKNAEDLVTWTQNLTNRTKDLTYWTRLVAIGAIGLVVWEVVAFLIEHHC
jgi:hypothetical protein